MNPRAMSELTEGLLRVYDCEDQAAYDFSIVGRDGQNSYISRMIVEYSHTPNTPEDVYKLLIALQKNMYEMWYDHGQGD